MRIQEITTGELRRMNDREGLVLQGCGGDLREWVDGINQLLTDYGVFFRWSKVRARPHLLPPGFNLSAVSL